MAGCLILAGCAGGGTGKPRAASTGAALDQVGVTSYPPGKRPAVPPLSGTTLEGKRLSLSQFAGDVVVINVWASWCDPCRAESPMLARLATTAGPQVRFIGIDETDNHAAAVSFVASVHASYPELSDEDGSLLAGLRLLPTKGIPSTLVVDAQGRMAARVIGPVTAGTLTGLIAAAGR